LVPFTGSKFPFNGSLFQFTGRQSEEDCTARERVYSLSEVHAKLPRLEVPI